jgi:hypothetical protein
MFRKHVWFKWSSFFASRMTACRRSSERVSDAGALPPSASPSAARRSQVVKREHVPYRRRCTSLLAAPIPHRRWISSVGRPHYRRATQSSLPPLCSAPTSLPLSRTTLDSTAGNRPELEGLTMRWRGLRPRVLLRRFQLLRRRFVPTNLTNSYVINFPKFHDRFPKIPWLVSLDRDSTIYWTIHRDNCDWFPSNR